VSRFLNTHHLAGSVKTKRGNYILRYVAQDFGNKGSSNLSLVEHDKMVDVQTSLISAIGTRLCHNNPSRILMRCQSRRWQPLSKWKCYYAQIAHFLLNLSMFSDEKHFNRAGKLRLHGHPFRSPQLELR
jgi:hypothetical protein